MAITMFRSVHLMLGCCHLAQICATQESGWVTDQVNTTMCTWRSPRVATVRNTVYIDGGDLWWMPGMSDGTYGNPIADGNPLGLVYTFSLSTRFTTSQNLTANLGTISKASGGGAANNIGPNYYNGGMFANDYQWITYGGSLRVTDAYSPPGQDAFAKYVAFATESSQQFRPGFVLGQLPRGVNRYVSDGAAISIPSENLAFYFSGLKSSTSGPIYYLPGPSNESMIADRASPTLVEADMAAPPQEMWKNHSLPDTVPGRAGAEVVWVPRSTRGLLVAIGGVVSPAYVNSNQTNSAAVNAASERESPKFLSTVAIYDVATTTWYQQDTVGAPATALAQGCAVVASAADGSSHNIYWYGGFDGLHLADSFSDDVWVLSLPSFTWIKVFAGRATHARAGHRCVKPYPDQMMVVGGYRSLAGGRPECLEGGALQVFNLSSLKWLNAYDPERWSEYSPPRLILDTVSSTDASGPTKVGLASSASAHTSVMDLLDLPYNSKIVTWYPYPVASAGGGAVVASAPHAPATKSGAPRKVAIALSVILVVLVGTGVFLWRFIYKKRWKQECNEEVEESPSTPPDQPVANEQVVQEERPKWIDGDPIFELPGNTGGPTELDTTPPQPGIDSVSPLSPPPGEQESWGTIASQERQILWQVTI